MKHIVMSISFILLLSGVDAQTSLSTKGMKRQSYVMLSAQAVKRIDVKKLPKGLKLNGNRIVPANGFKFIGKRNIHLVLSDAMISKLRFNSEGEVTVHYEVVTSGRLGTNDGDYYVVCSCGSNVFETSGDGCEPWLSNGALECRGPCTGRNEGSSCSMKGFHVYDDGRIERVPG